MKNKQWPLFGILLSLFFVSAQLSRGDSLPIISEWNPSIQIIPSETFSTWPDIDSAIPVDVSAEAGRIWLFWPRAMISLNIDGQADAYSLLSIFATTADKPESEKWSPESGVLCSDGLWRSFNSAGDSIEELDPFTGLIRRRSWNGPVPDSIYPGPEGSLFYLSGSNAGIIDPGNLAEVEKDRFQETIPPLSMLSLARNDYLVAWKELLSGRIRVARLSDGRFGKFGNYGEVQVNGTLWGMDFAGPQLFLSGPGRLTAISVNQTGEPVIKSIEDPRLPKRWYRIRGGEEILLVHSPETAFVALVNIIPSSASSTHREDFVSDSEYGTVLKEQVLQAGRLLEEAGYIEQAVAFYGWALPQIRIYRSRYPLSDVWPELERNIADRRAGLRDQY